MTAPLLYLANLGCIDQNPWMSRRRLAGKSRLHADRPRPLSLRVRPHRRGRATRAGKAATDRLRAFPRPPAATACTSTSRSSRSTPTTSPAFAEIIARWSQPSGPTFHHAAHRCQARKGQSLFRLYAGREVARPFPRRTCCAPIPARPSRRRSNGMKLCPD